MTRSSRPEGRPGRQRGGCPDRTTGHRHQVVEPIPGWHIALAARWLPVCRAALGPPPKMMMAVVMAPGPPPPMPAGRQLVGVTS